MTIATLVKNNVKAVLYRRKHLIISGATESTVLENFFSSVRPISTNHELIRIGSNADGGYLIPNDLAGINVCFSPGVSVVADFEADLASRGIKCFLADYSVDAPPVTSELIHFEKKYLGQTEDYMYTTMESWIERNASNQREFILQMDIEGGEYPVIFHTSSETIRKFRILVIEFHKMESLYYSCGFDLIDLTFRKLLRDFDVVHIHPNNYAKPIKYGKYEIPPFMEFTFLRKDRIKTREPALNFPHPLDRKNVSRYEDFALPRCWFGES